MAKKIFLMVGGLAVQKYGMALEKNQEVLSNLADIMIQILLEKVGCFVRKTDCQEWRRESEKCDSSDNGIRA